MGTFKLYLPQILIGLGVLLSFLGGLILYIRTNDFEQTLKLKSDEVGTLTKENIVLSEENKELLKQNLSLSENNNELANTNIKLSNQNLELSSNIKDLSLSINSNITGGNSFCYITLSFNTDNTCRIVLLHSGNYPLQKVQIRINDLDMFKSSEKLTLEKLTKHLINIDELKPKTATLLGTLNLEDKGDYASFYISLMTTNGEIHQNLVLKKFNNKWHQAIRVQKGNEILLEKIDPSFPVEPNENIWK